MWAIWILVKILYVVFQAWPSAITKALPPRKAVLGTLDWVLNQGMVVSEGGGSPRSQCHPQASHAFACLYSQPSPGAFVSRSFYLGPWAEVFFRDLLIGEKEREIWRCFPYSWLSTSTFPPQPFRITLPLTSESIKLTKPCLGTRQQWDGSSTWPLMGVPFHRGRRERGKWCFLQLKLLLIPSQELID